MIRYMITEIIDWCNTNNGFLTGILSFLGLFLSTIAIFISIRTARFPYKKKILLGSSILLSTFSEDGQHISSSTIGFEASATNIGNRTVNLTYIGYAVKINGKYNKMYPINRNLDCKVMLQPSEYKGVQFMANELIDSLSKLNMSTILFAYAIDSEGKEYKQKVGTVGRVLDIIK